MNLLLLLTQAQGHLRHVYHCKVCAEFDLCLRCAQDIKEIHAHHEFVGYHLPSKL